MCVHVYTHIICISWKMQVLDNLDFQVNCLLVVWENMKYVIHVPETLRNFFQGLLLVVQGLRIHLATQRTSVWSPVQEDSLCLGAIKPNSSTCWGPPVPEPVLRSESPKHCHWRAAPLTASGESAHSFQTQHHQTMHEWMICLMELLPQISQLESSWKREKVIPGFPKLSGTWVHCKRWSPATPPENTLPQEVTAPRGAAGYSQHTSCKIK